MNKKEVLIVDDDIDLGESVAELLESEGYGVTFISDPFKALEAASARKYDFMIIDFKMPGMDGLELTKNIVSKKIKTKILVISGKPFVKKLFTESGMDSAVTEFISKPFKCEHLIEVLERLSAQDN